MQCAVCDSPLAQQSFESMCIEYCKKCDGYWFDGNEIINVFNFLTEHPDLINKGTAQKVNGKLQTGYCPKCNQIAKPLNYYKKEYTFLKCVGCNGIWIDKNNLNLLLKDWKKNKNIFGKYYFSPNKEPKLIQLGGVIESYTGWLEDSNPLNRIPYTTILLIVLNIIGFFVWNPIINFHKEILFTPAYFFNKPTAYWSTIFISMFTHANFSHLIGNMIYLYLFGNNVEDRIGHYKYFFLYISLGIIATLGYGYLTTQSNVPTLGASGAVSGVLGSYLLLYPKVNMKIHRTFFLVPCTLNVPMWGYLGIWFLGLQLFGITTEIQGIAWYAHLIGFISGYIIMLLIRKLNFL